MQHQEEKQRAVSLLIRGRVQGVGFRYFVLNEARLLGIRGFVRNLANGSVYVEDVGEPGILEVFIQSCRTGPARAVVTAFLENDMPYTFFRDFRIS